MENVFDLAVAHKRRAALLAIDQKKLTVGETWPEHVRQCELDVYIASKRLNERQAELTKERNTALRPVRDTFNAISMRHSNTIAARYRAQAELKIAASEAAEKRKLVDALTAAIANEPDAEVAAAMRTYLESEETKLQAIRNRIDDLKGQVNELQGKLSRIEREGASALAAFDSVLGA